MGVQEARSPAATGAATATFADGQNARRRVLIVKLGAIGDVIMAIPAAAALHAEGYAIDWVASTAVAPLLAAYPWINVLAASEPTLLRGPLPARSRAMMTLWRDLRRQTARYGPYELAATLYYDPRYRLLSLPVQARRRLSLSRTDRQHELLPGRHHTDEYARILLRRPDGERPFQLEPVPVPDLQQSPLPRASDRPRVVLFPAGARNALRDDALRRWPISSYVALADALLRKGCEVVLAGGPDDRWAASHFAPLAKESFGTLLTECIGKFSLLETLALLDAAEVTVTHDTGPLHLAGITRTGLLSIFGPTDPHGRLPQRPNALAIWGGEGFACRPCYDGRDYAPCPHNGCMAQVTPEMVLFQLERLLEAKRGKPPLLPRVLTPSSAEAALLRSERL